LESLAHGQSEIGPEDSDENCAESGSSGAAVVSVIKSIRSWHCAAVQLWVEAGGRADGRAIVEPSAARPQLNPYQLGGQLSEIQ
jgi:hypothetical protein